MREHRISPPTKMNNGNQDYSHRHYLPCMSHMQEGTVNVEGEVITKRKRKIKMGIASQNTNNMNHYRKGAHREVGTTTVTT